MKNDENDIFSETKPVEKLNFSVEENAKNTRLDLFVLAHLKDLTRSHIKGLIEKGSITVNGGSQKSGYLLKVNDNVEVCLPFPEPVEILPEDIKLDVVYEDDYLAVINKPQNMVVHPAGSLRTGTLVNALLYHVKNLSGINGDVRPGIVHRLDKDTSGLIVVAKDDKTHLNLQKQIQEKTCHRIYRAVCYGKFNNETGSIETHLARGKSQHEKIFVVPASQGRYAKTHYHVLSYNSGFSYVEFKLDTGRTHQIRVHASYLNHPVVGDKLYGKKNEKFGLSGQLLHAFKLVFSHPKTGERMQFLAPIPDYFKDFLTARALSFDETKSTFDD